MLKNNCIIKIKNPCSENWDNMNTNSWGKYCTKCAKNIIDFTLYTDKQLIEYFKLADSKVCGKLKPSQVNRNLKTNSPNNKTIHIYTLLTSITFFALSKEVIAKHKENNTEISSSIKFSPNKSINEIFSLKDSTNIILKGKIIDSETKDALIGATIEMVGNRIGTCTNIDGAFELKISEKYLSKNMTFKIGFIGYGFQEFSISKEDLLNEIVFELTSENVILGEITIIKQPNKWRRFKKKHNTEN